MIKVDLRLDSEDRVIVLVYTVDLTVYTKAIMGFKDGCLVSSELNEEEGCYKACLEGSALGRWLGFIHGLPEGAQVTTSREFLLRANSKDVKDEPKKR